MKIALSIENGTPQYLCSSCRKCTSVFGKSLSGIKNRGCCWYFPKFTLHEIARMSKSKEGLDTLKMILDNPGTTIYNYYIHAEGYFDKEGYEEYINSGQDDCDTIKDKSMFFRTCPFVEEGKGCKLHPMFRSYVCNFFICNEVLEETKKNCREEVDLYIKEMESYSRWLNWDNYSLEKYFLHKNLDLKNNFDEIIEELKQIDLEEYEYPQLLTIE